MPQADAPDPIRVFLVDDHEVVRRGVSALPEGAGDMRIVGEAGPAEQAMSRIPAVRPHGAVLDVRWPDGSGAGVCRDIRSGCPRVACLAPASFADGEALFDAVMAGAVGGVLKQVRGADRVGAVRTVARGGSLLGPKSAARVLERPRGGGAPDPLAELAPQERQVLELIGEGAANRQIGVRPHLAEETVRNCVLGPPSGLDLKHRTQAAVPVAQLCAGDN